MSGIPKLASALCLAALLVPASLRAHCEIPCGIYDDHARIHLIEEHITTIEKSINSIKELQQQKEINYNQLVRWITNKDDHAHKLQEIVWQYFMTQRIKVPDAGDKMAQAAYTKKLSLLHEMLVYAMKAKQTVDLDTVEKLRELIATFEKAYMGDKSN